MTNFIERGKIKRLHHLFMAIHLKITNSSEVVNNNSSNWFQNLTPFFNRKPLEDEIINRIIKQLSLQGIKGEISAIKDLQNKNINYQKYKTLYTKTF